MVTVAMGTVRRLPCRVYAAAEAALAPPGGHVQSDGAQEGGEAPPPPCQLLCLPHRGLFLPLQRERLKNIERICCLLRKVSVRARGRRLVALPSPSVTWSGPSS